MESTDYNSEQKQKGMETQQNEQASDTEASGIAAFPNNSDTNLQDISTLLGGAPVLQQERSATAKTGSVIASQDDFADTQEERPFARKIAPKTLASAALALLILLPMAAIFMGGSSGLKNDGSQVSQEEAVDGEEGGIYISPEVYAAQQAELEEFRSQRAFVDQQVDAEAIDTAGRQKQQAAAAKASAGSPTIADKPATSTVAKAQPASANVRPAAPPPRAASVAARSPSPAPVTLSRSVSQPSAQIEPEPELEPEPIDPFERRAQLQALGSYGSPPPVAQVAARSASYEAYNPFEMPYIQAIAIETPPAQPAFSTSSIPTVIPEAPLTEEELQYQQDADDVLAAAPLPEALNVEGSVPAEEEPVVESDTARSDRAEQRDSAVLDPRRRSKAKDVERVPQASAEQPTAVTPMAIMPGTNVAAKLPYGFTWQEGTPLPDVLLMTTEDVMVGELAVIPAGTQFLGQAQIDPRSGSVTIQVVGLFGETKDIQIPRSSVIVQATDGSILTAKASDGQSSSDSSVSRFLMESLGNSLGNVIDSDDSLAGDLAGGVAETIIDRQIEHAEANAAARRSQAAAQPTVWALDSRPVRLTFNSFIPIPDAQR